MMNNLKENSFARLFVGGIYYEGYVAVALLILDRRSRAREMGICEHQIRWPLD